MGLFYRALTKSILSIYPVPYDEDNKWVSPPEVFRTSFPKSDSLFVRQSFPAYMKSLVAAKKDKDYSHSDKYLQELKKFSEKNTVPMFILMKKRSKQKFCIINLTF